jgi:thiamine biosynthesis lipoprotein
MNELAELESLISSWKPGSDTARVNEAAGTGPVQVGHDLVELLNHSLDWTEKTGGAFDVTGGPLFELWEQARERGRLPSGREVKTGLTLTGGRYVEVEDHSVFLQHSGMKLGFGAIGKGFAADRLAATLEAKGFTNFLIDAGGDLLVRGRCGDRSWQVAVRHPREQDFLARLEATDCAVATSGDYQRFFAVEGKRYSHIVDLRTGWPATHLTGVTVIAGSATDADALATALFVMEPTEGIALIESLPKVEAILVGEDGNLTLSGGLQMRGNELTIRRQ